MFRNHNLLAQEAVRPGKPDVSRVGRGTGCTLLLRMKSAPWPQALGTGLRKQFIGGRPHPVEGVVVIRARLSRQAARKWRRFSASTSGVCP